MGVPELPEVETVARDLAQMVVGERVVSGRIIRAANLSTPDPTTFSRAIVGRRIEGVRRRAKWILIDLEGGLILMVHLRMTGQLLVLPGSAPIDRYIRVILGLADGREIRFRDVRAFGRLALVARRDDGAPSTSLDPADSAALSDHGPEPLEAAFTAASFQLMLAPRRGRLKSLLLDQRFIAGLGNIYVDEALWRAQLHPLAVAAALRPAEAERLYTAIVEVLSEAVAARGSSIDDYTGPDGDGSMQERLAVYQRGGEPCLRCNCPIRRATLGGRGTHFCPRCQPLPRGRRAAGSAATMRGGALTRKGPRWSEGLQVATAGATRAERAAARRRAARSGISA